MPEIDATALAVLVAALFHASGISTAAAQLVADSMVEADMSGQASHGVMLVDMYLQRLRNGSISRRETGDVVSERGATVVLDAGHALGQLIGFQAIGLAVGRARLHGAGVVAVRHGFHFGVARQYATAMAEAGCIGMAMCNTRPLMPAPGGGEAVVGNNPIAIAVPTADTVPLVLDMATSEAAMGKIRMAAKDGAAIPPGWAVAADGAPTTDPEVAIKGMLLPAAGPKGFGLSLMIDMMCGLLSSGAHGNGVKPLYGDPSIPYDCSMLFVAIDVPHFRDPDEFRAEAMQAARRVREGRTAPSVDRLHTPGSIERARREAADGRVRLAPAVVGMLCDEAKRAGVDAAVLANVHDVRAGER